MDTTAQKEEEEDQQPEEMASTKSDTTPMHEEEDFFDSFSKRNTVVVKKNGDQSMMKTEPEAEDCDCSTQTPNQSNQSTKEVHLQDRSSTKRQNNKSKAQLELGGDSKRHRELDNKDGMTMLHQHRRGSGSLKTVDEASYMAEEASLQSGASTDCVDNSSSQYKRENTNQEKIEAYRNEIEEEMSIADASITSWKSKQSIQSHKEQLNARRERDRGIYRAMTKQERQEYNAKRRDQYHRQSQASRQKQRERERNRYHQGMRAASDLRARNERSLPFRSTVRHVVGSPTSSLKE